MLSSSLQILPKIEWQHYVKLSGLDGHHLILLHLSNLLIHANAFIRCLKVLFGNRSDNSVNYIVHGSGVVQLIIFILLVSNFSIQLLSSTRNSSRPFTASQHSKTQISMQLLLCWFFGLNTKSPLALQSPQACDRCDSDSVVLP